MQSNSNKHTGFTLIEVIISFAIIAIISISVYNAYLLLIKYTKEGQVKQTSTLIGKHLSEEIKSASDNKNITLIQKVDSSIIPLTDEIQLTKSKNAIDEKYTLTEHFDEKGNAVTENYRYTANINVEPKKTKNGGTVSIDQLTNSQTTDVDNFNIYLIKENEKAKAVHIEPVNASSIAENKNIKIDLEDKDSSVFSTITAEANTLEYTFKNNNKIQISLDLKYCTGIVTIDVNNKTKTPLNLCVLNNNKAVINNNKGVLNEYYRSEVGSKIGVLYDINIKIIDEKGDKSKPIFITSFLQNIDIK